MKTHYRFGFGYNDFKNEFKVKKLELENKQFRGGFNLRDQTKSNIHF